MNKYEENNSTKNARKSLLTKYYCVPSSCVFFAIKFSNFFHLFCCRLLYINFKCFLTKLFRILFSCISVKENCTHIQRYKVFLNSQAKKKKLNRTLFFLLFFQFCLNKIHKDYTLLYKEDDKRVRYPYYI